MTVESPAIEWVRIVAERLGDLRDEVVFLGGATVGLLLTDPATATVRGTKDVDVTVEVGSWGEYAPLQERLREKGFTEDTSEGAPLCRWVVGWGDCDMWGKRPSPQCQAHYVPTLERPLCRVLNSGSLSLLMSVTMLLAMISSLLEISFGLIFFVDLFLLIF